MNEQNILKLGKNLGLIESIKIIGSGHRKEAVEAIELCISNIRSNIEKLYSFLSRNTEYNAHVQRMAYVGFLRPWSGNYERISSLLHAHMQLQASPSLNDMAETCKNLFLHREDFDAVRSPADLLAALCTLSNCSEKIPDADAQVFDRMWYVLKDTPGFGPKTAALFIKVILDVHALEVNRDLRFLNDFHVSEQDFVRVPVDSVIQYIFVKLTGQRLSFNTINQLIFEIAPLDGAEATAWDDLWFWGFITQHGGGEKRKLEINEAKFWALFGSPKSEWEAVKERAEEFISLLIACEASRSIGQA